MKIFVIHSGSDYNEVKEIIGVIKNGTNKTDLLMLKNGLPFVWKIEAKSKIKKANLILVVVGKTSYQSKYISWEIRKAINKKKEIVILKLSDKNILPNSLYTKNEFTDEKINIYTEYDKDSISDLLSYINNSDSKYELFNNEEYDPNILFEQYKLFLQSSESVIQRRQSISNFYLTVNSALLGLSGVIGTISISNILNDYIKLFIPIVGIVLCISWIRMIKSYGVLNSSKLKIINMIEKKLPIALYDAEWKVQTDKLNYKPYVSFTDSETRIPKIFLIIYSFILICTIAILIKNYL